MENCYVDWETTSTPDRLSVIGGIIYYSMRSKPMCPNFDPPALISTPEGFFKKEFANNHFVVGKMLKMEILH